MSQMDLNDLSLLAAAALYKERWRTGRVAFPDQAADLEEAVGTARLLWAEVLRQDRAGKVSHE